MMRITAFAAAVLALCGSLPGVADATQEASGRTGESPRPNIIFIFSDDHGAQAISAYGSYRNQTPNIDRIAEEGVLFENCFCTNSICAPSRAVVLTGKFSHLNGVITNRERFDGSQMTFPKLLQQAGYSTAMIGKWHLKSDPTGFDHWEVLPGQGAYYNPDFRTPDGRTRRTGYVTDIITDLALDWLKQGRDSKKPFLLMLQHKAPHRSWMPGPDHLYLYEDDHVPEPDTLFDDWSGRTSAAKEQEMTIAHHMSLSSDLKVAPQIEEGEELRGADRWYESMMSRLTPEQRAAWDRAFGPRNDAFREAAPEGRDLVRWKYQRYVKNYLRCIASVDANVGRVLDYLDESGLAENTIVVYSSDQGWFLGEHGWYDKRWMYEESFRMPFIVRWPGAADAGMRNSLFVQNIDFGPTFLDAAGVRVPDEMQGESLVPLLRGEAPDDWRRSVYYHYYENPAVHNVARHYGVRTDRYKLIHFYRKGEWELYDLQKDPDEMQSVYDDPDYEEVVRDMKAELVRLRAFYNESPQADEELNERMGLSE